MSTLPIVKPLAKPVYRAALVTSTGLLAPEWFPWFQSLYSSVTALTAAQSALATLQASFASEASVDTLQTQSAAASAALATAEAAIASIQETLATLTAAEQRQVGEISGLTARVATLEATPAGALSIRTVTANDTFAAADYTICADATSAALTVELPSAPVQDELHNLKKIDASVHVVTLDGNGKQIDGYSSIALVASGMSIEVQYDGAAWRIL